MKRALDLDGLTVTATLEPDQYGRLVVVDLHIAGRAITGEDLRKIPIGAIEQQASVASGERRMLHPREPGESVDALMARVAAAFKAVAATTPRPAGVLAREAGVSVGTMHNWIWQARKGGLLPPGDRRKRARPS